jgi:hypothetical protein
MRTLQLTEIVIVLWTKKGTFSPVKNPPFFKKLLKSAMFCHWVRFGTKIAGYLNKIGHLVKKPKVVFCGPASAES